MRAYTAILANKQRVRLEISERLIANGDPYDGWDFSWMADDLDADPLFGGGFSYPSVQEAFEACRREIIECHAQIVTMIRLREEETGDR